MFLLDTNVLSELRSGKPRQSEVVRSWASGVPANRLYFSAVTVLELEMGVLAMERRDARQAEGLRTWLEALLRQFATQILPFTDRSALLCAAMHVPDRRSDRDAMIASIAKEHQLILVTRNTGDFAGCGVELLNPWLPAEA